MQNSRPILLVEDDRMDAMTVKRAMRELNVANPLVHAANGEQALEYLRNDDYDKPCVILLDLNMPRMNGIEFLEAAKADEHLKKIPVVVLTTSGEKRDIIDSFNLNAAGYMVKPLDYEKFVETMRAIDIYWSVSEVPYGE
jgi:CheY-like chemotaxis protein